MKIAKKGGATPTRLVPIKVKWKAHGGKFTAQSSGELTIRALSKALASLLPKRGEPAGMQYFVMGPHLYLEKFDVTTVGKQATYKAVGRALVGKIHAPTDSHSQDICTFDVTFKTVSDRTKLPDIEVMEGDINPLPRGSRLQP